MAQVTLENVSKKFDQVVAVRDVNLTIDDKEFVVLVGPSGLRQDHTLRMVAGLEEITGGRSASASAWSTTCRRRTGTSPWCSRTTRSIPT